MPTENMSVTTTIAAPAEAVFAVLADPANHPGIDGTGWVVKPLDDTTLTAAGQTFRMAMYHPNHPAGTYEMVNLVTEFAPSRTIAWTPGQDVAGDGDVKYGRWIWRYDLAEGPSGTDVTLSYDWSAVPASLREHIGFPPFGSEHLTNSLAHLAEIVGGKK